MVKNVFGVSLAALMGLGLLFGVNQKKAEPVKAEPISTVDVYGTHNYFTGGGGVWGANHYTTNNVENELTFSRLTNEGGSDNGYLLMDSEVKHAGTYIFTAKMRMSEGFTDQNVGFGFWAGSLNRIKDTVISGQLAAGEWRDVSVKFEFNEQEANQTDSIHMWVLLADGYIDFYDMQFRQVFVGNLGENIFKDVGFENVDLSGGDRTGWNDRHSGKIACDDSQVLWTHEGENETYNQFLRLRTTEGHGGYADWCSMLNDWTGSWPKGIPAGEYFVEMDVRTNAAFDSNNVGFAFFSSAGARIERDLTPQVNKAAVGEWTHVTYRYPNMGVELTQAYADGVDSFQFWANTKDIEGWQLDIDNVSLRVVTLSVDERPEFDGGVYAFQWVEADNQDLAITISNLHGHDEFQVLNGEYVLVADTDYTYSTTSHVLSIKKEFLADFDDGVAEFVFKTEGGERGFTVEITHIQEDLPDVSEYELEETVFGGDFADLDVGYTMSEEQTEYAWGAVSAYDDGGVVIEEADGSHALQFKKPAGSTRSYASSFVIYHPQKIVEKTIVTMEFDYKYVGSDTDDAVNLCWVGNSNVSYHLIKLNGAKNPQTIEPQAKYRKWDIAYNDLANGYTHVKVSLRVDAATVTATNSIRFLMKYSGNENQELRIQNFSLKKWNKQLGSLTPTTATFDKANPADVTLTVKFAEGLSLYAVAADSKTSYVAESNYTAQTNQDGTITLTLKKEYLASLADGEHTFYVSSSENDAGEYAELEFVLTVSGQQGGQEEGGEGSVTPTPTPEPKPAEQQELTPIQQLLVQLKAFFKKIVDFFRNLFANLK